MMLMSCNSADSIVFRRFHRIPSYFAIAVLINIIGNVPVFFILCDIYYYEHLLII